VDKLQIPAKARYNLEIKINSKVYISIEDNKVVLQPLNRKYFKSLIGIGNTNVPTIKSLLMKKKIEKV